MTRHTDEVTNVQLIGEFNAVVAETEHLLKSVSPRVFVRVLVCRVCRGPGLFRRGFVFAHHGYPGMKPVTTKFHFKLTGGKVVEVSEPVEETRK